MPDPSKNFLDLPMLRHLAGDELFASGEQCFALGRVRQVRTAKDRVTARVAGSRVYRVKLWRRQDGLFFRCDCEAGQEETFCQHCVAVGLAWLARKEKPAASDEAVSAESVEHRDARRQAERSQLIEHLASIDKKTLASLLLEATDYDEILRRRLLLEAIGISQPANEVRSSQQLPAPDFDAYRRQLQEAIVPTGYVDYHAMRDYAQGVEEAIRPLASLLQAGWHDEVIALSEFVLQELDAASDRVDTGDALLNKAYDSLQQVHFEACQSAALDLKAFAARLLHYELEGGLGVFNNASKTYAGILGSRGVAEWRRLLLLEWESLDRSARSPHAPLLIDHRRFQVQALMERLAESEGNLAAQFAIRQQQVESVHDALAIAEWMQRNGSLGEAIQVAEQALQQFTAEQDQSALRDFLIPAYQKSERSDDSLAMGWAQFLGSPEVESFRALKNIVLNHPAADWPSWRQKALAHVRQVIQNGGCDPSRLIELLIDERFLEEAWHEATACVCRKDLLLTLARHREMDHPADALRVYKEQIAAVLSTGGRSSYREAIELLERIRVLCVRTTRKQEYERYALDLRAKHRQKRVFLRLLDASEGTKSP